MNCLRILVVDDEPLNLEIIREYLSEESYELVLFADSLAAWEHIQSPDNRYDVVLLDRMMPGLNGIEFLTRLKADNRFSTLPVVMQTAASSPEQITRGLQAGAYYYLTKPYEQGTLISIVRAALAEAQARQLLRDEISTHRVALTALTEARFEFALVREVYPLASLLAQAAENPETAAMGISELLCNALEHGNLGITYQEKSQLKSSNTWEQEITRRELLPENLHKRVRVHLKRVGNELEINICDEGQGFAWQDYLEISAERAFDPNGRGIALARMLSFTSLNYLGCGNEVCLRLPARLASSETLQ